MDLVTIAYIDLVPVAYMDLVTVAYIDLVNVSYMDLVTVAYMDLVTVTYIDLVTVAYMDLATVAYMDLVTVANEFQHVLNWAVLTINMCKTKELVFHRPNARNNLAPLELPGIECVLCAKLLGVWLQNDFFAIL